MGGVATDYGKMMSLLMHDDELKSLMLIPTVFLKDYTVLMNKYFIEAFTAENITDDGICRLVIRSAPQSPTGSQFVKEDNVIIEIFVPIKKDRVEFFERRINKLIDRIIVLFIRKKKNDKGVIKSNSALINNRKMCLENRQELSSSSPEFKRAFVQFSYKRVYS